MLGFFAAAAGPIGHKAIANAITIKSMHVFFVIVILLPPYIDFIRLRRIPL
jgi:hypothetical protein